MDAECKLYLHFYLFNKGKFVLYVSSCLQYKTDRIPVETETFKQSYEIFKKTTYKLNFMI